MRKLVQDQLQNTRTSLGGTMITWAFVVFIAAALAAIFGLGRRETAVSGIARILFLVLVVLFAVLLVGALI